MILENRVPQESDYATPPDLCDAIRGLMGEIDLDPASSRIFNDTCAKALRIYDKADNGLDRPWGGRVYLNPPGGKAKPRASAWYRRLVDEFAAGTVTEAVYMSFALDSFQWSQKILPITSFPTLIFDKRIKFYAMTPDGPVQTKAPTRPCAVSWLPPVGYDYETIRDLFNAFAESCAERGYSGAVTWAPG